jgi:hypothetical protein
VGKYDIEIRSFSPLEQLWKLCYIFILLKFLGIKIYEYFEYIDEMFYSVKLIVILLNFRDGMCSTGLAFFFQ